MTSITVGFKQNLLKPFTEHDNTQRITTENNNLKHCNNHLTRLVPLVDNLTKT